MYDYTPEQPQPPTEPEVPQEPETPQEPEEPNVPESPKTGDNFNINLWLAILFVSGVGLFGTRTAVKKTKEQQ